eukprot:scaffold625_cov324-Pavlova_lutheri.AAC.132
MHVSHVTPTQLLLSVVRFRKHRCPLSVSSRSILLRTNPTEARVNARRNALGSVSSAPLHLVEGSKGVLGLSAAGDGGVGAFPSACAPAEARRRAVEPHVCDGLRCRAIAFSAADGSAGGRGEADLAFSRGRARGVRGVERCADQSEEAQPRGRIGTWLGSGRRHDPMQLAAEESRQDAGKGGAIRRIQRRAQPWPREGEALRQRSLRRQRDLPQAHVDTRERQSRSDAQETGEPDRRREGGR